MDQLNLKIVVFVLSLLHFEHSFQASIDSLPKMSNVVQMMKNIQKSFDSFTKKLESNPSNTKKINFFVQNEIENPPFPEAELEFPKNKYDNKEIDNMPHSVGNLNTQYSESEAQARLNNIMENADSMMENFRYLIDMLQKRPNVKEKSNEPGDKEIEYEEERGDKEIEGAELQMEDAELVKDEMEMRDTEEKGNEQNIEDEQYTGDQNNPGYEENPEY